MIQWLKNKQEELLTDKYTFQERVFLTLTLCAEFVLISILLGDILVKENLAEVICLIGVILFSPLIVLLTLRSHKLNLGALFIAIGTVFVVLPITFFYGGGVEGGSVIWLTFCYLYIGLILTGITRYVMLCLLTIEIVLLYAAAYYNSGVIVKHSKEVFLFDSAISVILVGIVIFVMVQFQNRLFLLENKRASEQAANVEKLNRAQNRFFSSMSHEIRTPINTIIGLNEMILREDISQEVLEDAKNIESASKLLLSLINDILDMSKIESGKMDVVPVAYDVGKMLSEIVNMVWGRATAKGLQFYLNVDPTLPAQLFSDEVRIKQILINLLNNAIKYTKTGSITLSIHCRRTGKARALVTYSVEDTGMGIRKESIPYLFDAFRREDETENRYIEGTGLGLSIVKQLSDLLGGEITVDSVYTKGSTFQLALEQEVVGQSSIGEFSLDKLHNNFEKKNYHQSFEAPDARVLIIDDNRENLLVASKLLRGTKVSIDTALSGREALTYTLQNRYDAIFTDHMMPEMDGIQTFHAIREQAGGLNRETPVAVMTANAGSENQALYSREGFDGYLLKPIDASLLEEMLQGFLPDDLIKARSKEDTQFDSDKIIRQIRRKIPLMITTDSVSDLPHEIINRLKIPVLPYKVYTKDAVFQDGIEAGGDVIIRYMEKGGNYAKSEAPDVEEYERFFAEQLSVAQHILHIALAKHASRGFANASEAALTFYNVKVIDSGHLSSGTGLMTMAARLRAEDYQYDTDKVVAYLNEKKDKVQTSFIVTYTDYLRKSGRISESVHRFCTSFMVHPIIVMKNSSMKVGGVILGETDKAISHYIRRALRNPSAIDREVLFITYAGMRRQDVEKIRDMALSIVPFKKVYLQKASPAISINCGPGTFGLIFSKKEKY